MFSRTQKCCIHPFEKLKMNIPPITSDFKPVIAEVNCWTEGEITWHTLHDHSCEICKIEWVFPTGSADQSKSLQANFSANLLLEGTKQVDSRTFSKKLDHIGAYFNAECGRDYTSFTLHVLKENLNEALAIIFPIFTEPALERQEFESYCFESLEEFKQNSAQTGFIAKQELRKSLYNGHVYGSVAEENSFADIQLEDIQAFVTDFFIDRPFQLFISGNANNETISTIKNCLNSNYKSNIKKTTSDGKLNQFFGLKEIQHPTAQQDSVRIGSILPNSNHKDFIPLNVLISVFGGYFGSRLMQNIREEKGWTYGIGANILPGKRLNALMISADVMLGKGNATIIEIQKEIQKLQNELISQTELLQVCTYLKGNLLRSFDGVFEQMERYQSVILNGLEQDHYYQYFDFLNYPDANRLKDLANKYLKPEQFTSVIVSA